MTNIPREKGRLMRAVAFAAIVCAFVLKTLAFAPFANAASTRLGISAAISVSVPTDDCKSDGGAPKRGPLQDHGHCVFCALCGAETQADRSVLPAELIAFSPTRNDATWRGGHDGPPSNSASDGVWRARAPPSSA